MSSICWKNCAIAFIFILFIPLNNAKKNCTATSSYCPDGILFSAWQPSENISLQEKIMRAIIFFSGLLYLFLGVSIVADRFMASIEVITSKEKDIQVVLKTTGEVRTVSVRIWNQTVSNLTLMALGSSAPEILLSIIEIIGKKFQAGELGPGTIVGSAAFNLFVIVGICVLVIPNGQVRRIKHLRVFLLTAVWSLVAYIWLYIIIAVISPNEVSIWEGVVTFLMFPLTVGTSYIADTRLFIKNFMPSRYKSKNLQKGLESKYKEEKCLQLCPSDVENDLQRDPRNNSVVRVAIRDATDHSRDENNGWEKEKEMVKFEEQRNIFLEILRDLRQRYPEKSLQELELLSEIEMLKSAPQSRAVYRMKVLKALSGRNFNDIRRLKENLDERLLSSHDAQSRNEEINIPLDRQTIFFNPGHYTVNEDVGTCYVTVSRSGCNCDTTTVTINFTTQDGSAKSMEDYKPVKGLLTFPPGVMHKRIAIEIIDDDKYEEDEHFYISLSNPKLMSSTSKLTDHIHLELDNPCLATIMILDNDHSGVFHFEKESISIAETEGVVVAKVIRSVGSKGRVRLPYETVDGTAKSGKDYEGLKNFVEFAAGQTEGFISVKILDDNEYEKDETFMVGLLPPLLYEENDLVDKANEITPLLKEGNRAEDGYPRLGVASTITIHITENERFKNKVDQFIKEGQWSVVVTTNSWKQQFQDALALPTADDDGSTDGPNSGNVSKCAYFLHFMSLPWKVCIALLPPTEYGGGWVCFTASIVVIGILTAVIGDLAAFFGCTVGLLNEVTAITMVALGTSLPDMFASKVAATTDPYADSSIVNVTGSNAVNVFLGIGIAWTLAAIHHAYNGTVFVVSAGSLGFSVTIFLLFACTCITLMLLRRHFNNGELGGTGNPMWKYASGAFMIGLWVFYIILCSLESYCHIEGY